ncbi:hypothetical protein [Mesobacillus subterraneus]|uniref:hypothetical protein n=1 Tax=Mesobacillus subterraneus TaxID=285983 RepID=UPI001CFF20E1|nr:hypothetical protein [Mesobacillus subterraneus]
MPFSAIVVFAIVWGGLLVYFLTPFNGKMESSADAPFFEALKVGFKRLIFHKKAILAFLLLMFTLLSIWSYFISTEEYARLHAMRSKAGDPVLYMSGVVLYAAFLYLFLAVRWAMKSSK